MLGLIALRREGLLLVPILLRAAARLAHCTGKNVVGFWQACRVVLRCKFSNLPRTWLKPEFEIQIPRSWI